MDLIMKLGSQEVFHISKVVVDCELGECGLKSMKILEIEISRGSIKK